MSENNDTNDFAASIADNLPYLRRYARALTGNQQTGDRFAEATLEAIIADAEAAARYANPKVALFGAFHSIWSSTGAPVSNTDTALEARAHEHMQDLTTNTREAILLHVIEGFSFTNIGLIMGVSAKEAEENVSIALSEMANSFSGKIMIIEDEAIIAMDLQGIISQMGHANTGVARTHTAAVELSKKERPNLILADIQLADNSSGIEAVSEILGALGDIPVIFITAFPERLLTGERREPAFLIAKPYTEEQVSLAISQAMFFASTETLSA
ncbi:two-component response regulator [Amylibacter ulvae]|uniref:Two-component response regulator n=1 Tax=Paramylibacter ulvae TaxID=1651968 RepID=A0ABQ3CW90_9RHOB|nr:response regulator [Amylibacter ulvae]GHA44107.1 two-component response regulator [Amylibacter ulvae]